MPLRSPVETEIEDHRNRPFREVLVVSLPFLIAILWGAYPRAFGLEELRWLLEGRGALPGLADALLGMARDILLLRLPLLLLGLAGLLLAMSATGRRPGRVAVTVALVAVAVFPQMLVRASLLGPWSLGLLTTGAALALGSRRGSGRLPLLLVLGALAGWLDPGLAVAPLGVALAQLLPRRHAPLPALLAVAGAGFLWMALDTTAVLSRAPLPGAILALVLALVLALPTPRAAGVGALLLLIASATAWRIIPWTAPAGAPVLEALAAAGVSETGAAELLAGPGLGRGVAAHLARGLGMKPVVRPSAGRVGLLELAAARSPAPARRDLEERLGERVLERSILAGAEGLLLRFNLYRPFRLEIKAQGPRPNIAIVSVDTLRADSLPFYGYGRDTAPSLGRWSEGALVYERAFAPASKTAPSFASLMTGRLPVSHGLRSNYDLLDPGNWTLARVLRRAGYHTAAFVSSFVLTGDNCGLDLGFELYDQTLDSVERHRADRPLRLAPTLASAVEDWIGGRREQGSTPWFLWIHAIDPHGPYTPLPDFEGRFRSAKSRPLERDQIPGHQWLDTLDFFAYRDAYDAEILQADRSLGELVASLRALPSPEGLIVVFLSDHGESFGERQVFFQHGQSLHHEQTRVPLVVEDSLTAAAGREPRPVSLVDLMPTLLERLGIETDLPLEGLPLDRRVEVQTPVLGGWRPGEAMALLFPWKLHLLRHPDGEEWVEVYDLVSDPGESHPLPPDPVLHAELLAAARGLLDRDPLKGSLDEALRRERWEGLSPEEMEQLRALGYMGP